MREDSRREGLRFEARYVVEMLSRIGWKTDELIAFNTTAGEAKQFLDSTYRPAGFDRCRAV